MSIIIETCPKCGHDLTDLVIDTYPPIPQKKCFNCGWEWTGEREEVKIVTLEMFKKYHEHLMNYIEHGDGINLDEILEEEPVEKEE